MLFTKYSWSKLEKNAILNKLLTVEYSLILVHYWGGVALMFLFLGRIEYERTLDLRW